MTDVMTKPKVMHTDITFMKNDACGHHTHAHEIILAYFYAIKNKAINN